VNRGNGRGLSDEAKRYWAAQRKQAQRYGRRVSWQPTGQSPITMGLIALLVVGTIFASIVPYWSVAVASLPGGVLWLALLSNAIPGSLLGLLFAGVFLWLLGNQVEGMYEPWRYLVIYFAAGTLGALVTGLAGAGIVGGSLAVFGLAGAYAMYIAKVGSPGQALQWALILLVINLLLTGFNVAYMAGMVVAFVVGVGVARLS
jgi:membrane associated rhomboid family serine protease